MSKSETKKKEALDAGVSWDLSQFIAIPLEAIPQNRPLPYAIHIRIANHMVLFRKPEDILTTERATKLASGTDCVYIAEPYWDKYLLSLDVFKDEKHPKEDDYLRLRYWLMSYQEYLQRRQSLSPEHFAKFQELGAKLAEGLLQNPGLGKKLLRRYDDPSLYFVNHTVNVAIYSASVGIKLNVGLKDLQILTFASLMHNIGNLFVPRNVLFKPGSLTKEEWELIELHPHRGAQLLETYKAPKEVILTASQHHERMDGEGYPHKIKGQELHLFPRICTIADVYDALTNQVPYQRPIVPGHAIEKMQRMLGKFDDSILNMMTK